MISPAGSSDCAPSSRRAPRCLDPHALELFRLLAVSSVAGAAAGLVAWCFVEAESQLRRGVYDLLPARLGLSGVPLWWPPPVIALAGLLVAAVAGNLRGRGGIVNFGGVRVALPPPRNLPGIFLAGLFTVALGPVTGALAPLIALGSGVAGLTHRALGQPANDDATLVTAAAGSAAAISFVFSAPLFGAIVIIEAAGLEHKRFPTTVPTTLLASGLGALVGTGMMRATGQRPFSRGLAKFDELATFSRPSFYGFLWTVPLSLAIAIAVHAIFQVAQRLHPLVTKQRYLFFPVAGLVVGGLATAFAAASGRPVTDVLFPGQDTVTQLVDAGQWSPRDLALVLVFKGLAWAVTLSVFKGGPLFPGLFLGTAAGALAARLPKFSMTPAVAVGMGAGIVSAVRLPTTAVVFATLLTAPGGGFGAGSLVIVGVLVAFAATMTLARFMPHNIDGDDNSAITPEEIVR